MFSDVEDHKYVIQMEEIISCDNRSLRKVLGYPLTFIEKGHIF